MKVTYGSLRVIIKAEEDEINGDNELALSDRFSEFEDELYEWLKSSETRYPEFDFDLQGA